MCFKLTHTAPLLPLLLVFNAYRPGNHYVTSRVRSRTTMLSHAMVCVNDLPTTTTTHARKVAALIHRRIFSECTVFSLRLICMIRVKRKTRKKIETRWGEIHQLHAKPKSGIRADRITATSLPLACAFNVPTKQTERHIVRMQLPLRSFGQARPSPPFTTHSFVRSL